MLMEEIRSSIGIVCSWGFFWEDFGSVLKRLSSEVSGSTSIKLLMMTGWGLKWAYFWSNKRDICSVFEQSYSIQNFADLRKPHLVIVGTHKAW